MISNPIVVNVTLFIALLSMLVTIYFTARAIGFKAGQRTNGYVTQRSCDEKHDSLVNKSEKNANDLHSKMNTVVKEVAEIKGYLKKKL
jgi:hypothetical protein